MSSGHRESWIANTEGWHDGVHLLILALLVLPSCEVQVAFLRDHLKALGLAPAGAKYGYWDFGPLIAAALGFGLWKSLHMLLGRLRGFQLAKAALMVPAGGLLYAIAGAIVAFPLMLLVPLCAPALPEQARHVVDSIAFTALWLVAGFCAGVWGGWRAGARGAFWGAAATTVPVVQLVLWHADLVSATVVLWPLGMVLAGALGGRFGVGRFRRSLAARQTEQAGGKPAP